MSLSDQEWSAPDHSIYVRLSLVTFTVCAVAIALPFATKAAGTSFGAVMVLATVGLSSWSLWAVVQSRRTESKQQVRSLELRHMLVWANATIAYLLAGFTAMFVSGYAPGTAWSWWSFVAVMTLSWLALHNRINQLNNGSDH